MSDVPTLVWSNRPMPILMFKAVSNLLYTTHVAYMRKVLKNAMHTRIESVLSLHVLHCVFRYFDLRQKPCMHCIRQVGNWPLYCRSAGPVLWEGGDESKQIMHKCLN